ncbi:M20 family peptidase [soil metagenome]
MRKIFSVIGLALLALIVIVLVRTFIFTKEIAHTKAVALAPLEEGAIDHLSAAIQIKTISTEINKPIDTATFLAFRNFLDTTYPLIHQQLEKIVIDSFSYIYHWKGSKTSLKPYFFLAHSDVVPVEISSIALWHAEPFAGAIKDSAIWGRGSFDDKGSLIAIMETVEHLLQANYKPERDIYLCFGHDEELGGEKGGQAIAKWFKEKNIHAALAMDEGGIITKENFPDLQRPIALLGVSEKGYASFELTVEKEGGHSSMPEKETAIDILSKAVVKLREEQMPVHIAEPTNVMLEKIGPGLGFITRMALANRWLFNGLLVSQFEKSKGTNASIHTTIVPTILSAGIKDNVIPTVAKATVNSRIMPGETAADVMTFIKQKINDDRIKITKLPFGGDPGKITSMESPEYKKAAATMYSLLDDVVPVPFLMIGATDSRYYEDVADAIVKFLPAIDPKGFHGIDERLPFTDYNRMINFYTKMITEK